MVGTSFGASTSSSGIADDRQATPLGTRYGEAGERIRSARIRSARSARSSTSSSRRRQSGGRSTRPDSGMSMTDSYDEVNKEPRTTSTFVSSCTSYVVHCTSVVQLHMYSTVRVCSVPCFFRRCGT